MSRGGKRKSDSDAMSSSSSESDSLKRGKVDGFISDDMILEKIPQWPEKQRFMRTKGVIAHGSNKLCQYSVLCSVQQNWLSTGYYIYFSI